MTVRPYRFYSIVRRPWLLAALQHRLLQPLRYFSAAARGSNVARHNVLSLPRKHSENIFKSQISSNLSQQLLVLIA